VQLRERRGSGRRCEVEPLQGPRRRLDSRQRGRTLAAQRKYTPPPAKPAGELDAHSQALEAIERAIAAGRLRRLSPQEIEEARARRKRETAEGGSGGKSRSPAPEVCHAVTAAADSGMCSARLELRRLPRTYRRAFGWMLEPIKLFHSDPMAFVERPAASFARVERSFAATWERVIADGGPEAFVRRMFEPMATMTPAEWAETPTRLRRDLEKRRRQVARLPSGEALLVLVDAAHDRVRNGPLLAILHPERHGKAGLAAQGRVLRTRGTRGEIRVEAILDAIAFIWEAVYQPYLQSVWKLLEVLDGRAPVDPPSGDRLMLNLEKRLAGAFPRLVEPSALRIRNAVAHRHVELRLAHGAVTLSNKDGWSASFRRRDLEAMMCTMLCGSTRTFVDAMNAFSMGAIVGPLLPVFPAFARAVVAGDQAEIERAGALVKAQEDAIWTDVARLYGRVPASTS
jgi:hypothetical protein